MLSGLAERGLISTIVSSEVPPMDLLRGDTAMRGEIHPRIHRLTFWWEKAQAKVESYLVRGKVKAMIDTGPPQDSMDTIDSLLQSAGLSLGEIDLILHTHGHLDHIGGDSLFHARGGAQLMIHKKDAVFLEDHGRSFDLFYAPGRGEKVQQEKAAFLKEMEPELKADRLLEDRDLIDLGEGVQLRVVHLPGHTPGSVGFYWEREGIMLAGDSIQGLGSMAGFFPIIYDFMHYEDSIKRLMDIPLRSLCLCHAYRSLNLPPSPLRQGEEVRQYLSDSLKVFGRLREAIDHHGGEAGEKSLAGIADRIVGELGEEMGYKRMSELPSPLFSLWTVYWGISQARGGSREAAMKKTQ